MQVQIIESNRGGKFAVHNGHSYNQEQTTINCIHWRCIKYYKLKFPAILETENETVIETKGTHNHDPGECKAKKLWTKSKQQPNIQHQHQLIDILLSLMSLLPFSYKTVGNMTRSEF